MWVIVGLGNPSKKHKKNRHNVGFIIVDKLVSDLDGKWVFEKRFNAMLARHKNTLFVKPQAFMNKSGEAVARIMHYFKLSPGDLTLIHDDIDLKFGQIKDQTARGSAGHKGVADIINKLGTANFRRIRIGVGRPTHGNIGSSAADGGDGAGDGDDGGAGIGSDLGIKADKWVLMDLSDDEINHLISLLPQLEVGTDPSSSHTIAY